MASADLDLRKLQLALDKKGAENIYLLHGEEIFLVDQALKAIKEKVLTPGMEDFNYDNFMAPEVSPAHVMDAAVMLPVMVERRLVIYKNIETVKDDQWDAFQPLIDNPCDSCTVVLVAQKIDKRKKIFKKLLEASTAVDLKKPFENQIGMWVGYIGYLNDIQLSPDATTALQQLVGTNLSEINNEVQKIKQYIKGKKTVEIDDVLHVVSKARIESIFSLTEAIARKDRSHALMCLANLLEHGQNEVGIVSLIHRQIRILAAVNEGLNEGLSGMRLSQKVGVPEFFLKQYVSQSRKWDRSQIKTTLKALHDTDLAIKSSPVSSHIWLENFIVKTC